MSRTGRWSTQTIVGLILLVVGVAAAVVLALSIPDSAPLRPGDSTTSRAPITASSSTTSPPGTTSSAPAGSSVTTVSDVSLGESIYVYGADENGRLIPRSGVMRMMGSGVACANCHGPDARGRTIQVMMMGQVETPDIRWSALTAPPDDPEEIAFDPDSFFRAVTQGSDPEGGTLKPFMPRWELTRAESDALIEYLKTR